MTDLILRMAAVEAIVSLTAFESEDELKKFVEEKACDDYYLGGLCDAIDEIKDTAAVDAVSVVHAHWVDCKDDHQCSACKEHTIYDVYAWKAIQFEFCPHCGAKMDGERRDSE